MVRTRQMGCGDDALATSESLSCNIGRRKDCRISGNVDEVCACYFIFIV